MVRLLVSKVAARSSARCLPLPCSSSTIAKRRSVRFICSLSAVIVQDAPAIAACLQFGAGADMLQLAGGENDPAPLTQALLDFGDRPSLPGAADIVVSGEQACIEPGCHLLALCPGFFATRLQLIAACQQGGALSDPGLFCLAQFRGYAL